MVAVGIQRSFFWCMAFMMLFACSEVIGTEELERVQKIVAKSEFVVDTYGENAMVTHRRTRYGVKTAGSVPMTVIFDVKGFKASGLAQAEFDSRRPNEIRVSKF